MSAEVSDKIKAKKSKLRLALFYININYAFNASSLASLSSIKKVASISAIDTAKAKGYCSKALPTEFLSSVFEKPIWYLMANASSRRLLFSS